MLVYTLPFLVSFPPVCLVRGTLSLEIDPHIGFISTVAANGRALDLRWGDRRFSGRLGRFLGQGTGYDHFGLIAAILTLAYLLFYDLAHDLPSLLVSIILNG
jgi:hypothetical protein